ncbi:hypothetical protein [Desulfosporosinus sp. FKB]|uniref:hypothetical protein n=1 Tax=Desulfosporosinus sp. FKB TaxID=1969835 RepID=UPI001124D3EA|nr:hypothetical protein [Desulfosporosinus sp. FKB]
MQFRRQVLRSQRESPHGPVFKEILADIVCEGQEKGVFRKDIAVGIIIEMFMGLIQSTMNSNLEIPFMDNLKQKLYLFLEGLGVKQ